MIKFAQELIKKYKLEEFIKFVIVGVLATGINYVIYLLFLKIIDKSIAYTIGYAISFCFNLIASHLFTFKKEVNTTSSIKFGLAHLFNYLLQLGLLNLFHFFGVPEKYAPIPMYFIAVPVNFLVVRFALNTKLKKRQKNNDKISKENA